MPPEWEEDDYNSSNFEVKNKKLNGSNNGQMVTNRPPLYNAEDYTCSLRQMFSITNHILLDHPVGKSKDHHHEQQEMGMKKFLNGSELLFKLEADLRTSYSSFLQEFVSAGHCEGVWALLDALKYIQSALDECSGLREQRKLIADEQKCLHCIKLCLRNIEAIAKLSSYSGGLYPIAAAMISTVTSTRIVSLEIMTCLASEGGADGHYKVSEAISTLRLRIGEPIRCKLLVGAICSSSPGTFQAKGIKFLTAWISSAPSPKNKVHIQCELEEAGFNAVALRKNAENGGAKESREVQAELDEWDRVTIDIDILQRQNNQLRNSVSTLQQELATLKDKLRRMDVSQKLAEESKDCVRKRNSRKQIRAEELITTPVDSEEEQEQIHQILEDLNNIVNSQMTNGGFYPDQQSNKLKKEKEIVPVQLMKSPPKKNLGSPGSNGGGMNGAKLIRPWPGSSASDDEDSDILIDEDKFAKPNVKKVVQQLENMEKGPKFFPKSPPPRNPLDLHEPKPDYNLPTYNFHKQNHMLSKFQNFKSPKLLYPSSSPESSNRQSNVSSGYAEIFEKSSSNQSRYTNNNHRGFSPNFDHPPYSGGGKKGAGPYNSTTANPIVGTNLRRSESLHASLASIDCKQLERNSKIIMPYHHHQDQFVNSKGGKGIQVWKSMENLEKEHDENFTLRWRYPNPLDEAAAQAQFEQQQQQQNGNHITNSSNKKRSSQTPSPKSGKSSSSNNNKSSKGGKNSKNVNSSSNLIEDYRQSRFTKNSKSNGNSHSTNGGGNPTSSSINIFSRYTKKSTSGSGHQQQQQQMQHNSSSANNNCAENYPPNSKEKESMKMFSLPPILMTQDMHQQRLSDLPSGLY